MRYAYLYQGPVEDIKIDIRDRFSSLHMSLFTEVYELSEGEYQRLQSMISGQQMMTARDYLKYNCKKVS